MLKVGDTVKVISDTVSHWDPEERTEYIPIGTICVVRTIDYNKDGSIFYEIKPIGENYMFCYQENELEKGHMEWVKDGEETIRADQLIDTFTDMANRGTLLCGRNATQEDILIQIIGAIVKVSMDL